MTATDPSTMPMTAAPDGAVDWAAALAEHGRWLRTVVRARLGEGQGVDEVMQEVSLAAVAQRSPLSDPAKVGAWLYRLAVRQSLLYRRAQGRRRRLVGRYAEAAADRDGLANGGPDPLAWLMAEERDALVRRAVDALPPKDRELMMLKYTEGWTARELAERLGQSPSAVEARLHRVRRALRARLARLADGRDD